MVLMMHGCSLHRTCGMLLRKLLGWKLLRAWMEIGVWDEMPMRYRDWLHRECRGYRAIAILRGRCPIKLSTT